MSIDMQDREDMSWMVQIICYKINKELLPDERERPKPSSKILHGISLLNETYTKGPLPHRY